MQAMRIIREEHQSLAAVLHGLNYLVREIRRVIARSRTSTLLGAMVYYIDTFPERFHHPKEDAVAVPIASCCGILPPALLAASGCNPNIARAPIKLRQLEQALLRYQAGGERSGIRGVRGGGRGLRRVRAQSHAQRGNRGPSAGAAIPDRRTTGRRSTLRSSTTPTRCWAKAARDDFRDLFRRIVIPRPAADRRRVPMHA